MLRLIEERRVTTSHMVPTQFHRLLALPEDVRDEVRRVLAAPHDPRRRPVPDRRQAQDDRLVGQRRRRVLRGQRGRRHAGHAPRNGCRSRAPSASRGRSARSPCSTTTATGSTEPNVIGTVYMAMQSADFEYHGDKEKTRKNRIGAFFTVGDVGLIDEDGYLFLRDRKIDMIISGGANIYPAEIENVLLSHPKVGDAAVFGIPHEDWGEEVKAVIEPADGVEADDALADGDPGVLRRQAGQVQDAQDHRLHERDAPRPQRQALQAQAARPLLGRRAAGGLTARSGRRPDEDVAVTLQLARLRVQQEGAGPSAPRSWPPCPIGSATPTPWRTTWSRRTRIRPSWRQWTGGLRDPDPAGAHPYAAEIVVMGVLPEHHRAGIGRAMLSGAETWLAERDITYPPGEDPQPALLRRGLRRHAGLLLRLRLPPAGGDARPVGTGPAGAADDQDGVARGARLPVVRSNP